MPPRSKIIHPLLSLIFVMAPTAHGEPPRRDSYGDPLPEGAVYRIGTTRLQHTPSSSPGASPACEDVCFHPSGRYFFSSCWTESAVFQWETATGREVRRFPTGTNTAFALSPDGSVLAVNRSSGIGLYETASGKKRREIEGGPSGIAFLAYSPDGHILTALCDVGGWRPSVIRWDTTTGHRLGEWHAAKGQRFVLSPDCRIVASFAEKEDILNLRDVANGKSLRRWEVEEGENLPWCLRFSPDGRVLAAVGSHARIRIRDTANGKLLHKWKMPSHPNQHGDRSQMAVDYLAFAPDGKTLASVDRSGVLRLWDWRTGGELRRILGMHGPIAFSHDGKILAAAGKNSRLHLWEPATGHDLVPFADPGTITHVSFSPDGRMLAASSDGGPSLLVDALTGRRRRSLPGYRPIAFSPAGGRLLALQQDGQGAGPLCLVDAASGTERVRFPDTEEQDRLGAWSPDGKILITIGTQENAPARIWDAITGKQLRVIRGEKNNFVASCSPDARLVAVMEEKEAMVHLFAADTGKELRRLMGCNYRVPFEFRRPLGKGQKSGTTGIGGIVYLGPLFSPDGKALLVGREGKSFALWDVAGGKETVRLNSGEFAPKNAEFSPDGRFLCLLDPRGDSCLLNAVTGQVHRRLTWEGGDLNWIFESVNHAFSADGRLLAATYDDRTLVLWETVTGGCIRVWSGAGNGDHRLRARDNKLRQMVFSPDGRRLAMVNSDGTALVWDVIGLSRNGRLPMRKLTAEKTEQAWRDLAAADAAKGHRAIWTLATNPDRALPLLRQRLQAVPQLEQRRIARLITDLDSDTFAVRDKATRELRQLGKLAEAELRQAIRGRPSLELRRRAQVLLQELNAPPSGDSLRALRAVAVLEYMSDPQSLELLHTLAAGAPAAALSREAKAALRRRTKM